ncbi:MAG: glycosyltransferase [Patescibacteria group bacterium]|jgi:GT2 family glycosyltransferase
MKLVVGFLTYNEATLAYLPDFLESLNLALKFLPKSDYRIFAFDNSEAGYLANQEYLKKFSQEQEFPIEFWGTNSNLGFSRAYNILLTKAEEWRADYFLIINPDVIIEPEAIKLLIQALEQNQSLASVSPKLRRWNFATNTKTKIIDSAGLRLQAGLRFSDLGQGEVDEGQYDHQTILGPSGAAGLFRLTALGKIKTAGQFFDEDFFMYKEDCDLALRLAQAGELSQLVPTALVYHDRTAFKETVNPLAFILNRRRRSQAVRRLSFVNQHYLFIKYWPKESIGGKIIIMLRVSMMAIYALSLERFLLKEYQKIRQYYQARQEKKVTVD